MLEFSKKIENIKICINLLERILDYKVQYVQQGNTVWSSSPSELASKTYDNLSSKIDKLTKDIFYKTLSEIIGRNIDENSSINDFALGNGNCATRENTLNLLKALKTQLFIDYLR